jgi:hypothetical protein
VRQHLITGGQFPVQPHLLGRPVGLPRPRMEGGGAPPPYALDRYQRERRDRRIRELEHERAMLQADPDYNPGPPDHRTGRSGGYDDRFGGYGQ